MKILMLTCYCFLLLCFERGNKKLKRARSNKKQKLKTSHRHSEDRAARKFLTFSCDVKMTRKRVDDDEA